MRWSILVVVVGLFGVAASAWGRPPANLKGRKLDVVPFPQSNNRPAPQLPPNSAWGRIRVEFRGPLVRVESSRDISNVVLEYGDGTRQKFDDLKGRMVELRGTGSKAGKEVIRAWVKSGANFSGDGPGYGQKFERPDKPPSRSETANPRTR